MESLLGPLGAGELAGAHVNAVLSYVNRSDLRLSGQLSLWSPPRWLRVWMIWATWLGDGWLWLGTGTFLILGRSSVLGAAAVSAGITNVLVVILKRRFRRPRPRGFVPSGFLGASGAERLGFDRFSFPSGHSMNAFAVATVLTLAAPALGPLWGLIASSIAASRLVLGHHFVSDVVAGSALGIAVGFASFRLIVG